MADSVNGVSGQGYSIPSAGEQEQAERMVEMAKELGTVTRALRDESTQELASAASEAMVAKAVDSLHVGVHVGNDDHFVIRPELELNKNVRVYGEAAVMRDPGARFGVGVSLRAPVSRDSDRVSVGIAGGVNAEFKDDSELNLELRPEVAVRIIDGVEGVVSAPVSAPIGKSGLDAQVQLGLRIATF